MENLVGFGDFVPVVFCGINCLYRIYKSLLLHLVSGRNCAFAVFVDGKKASGETDAEVV